MLFKLIKLSWDAYSLKHQERGILGNNSGKGKYFDILYNYLIKLLWIRGLVTYKYFMVPYKLVNLVAL